MSRRLQTKNPFTNSVDKEGSYSIVIPKTHAKIAFLKNEAIFVSNAKQHISEIQETTHKKIQATIEFAAGKTPIVLHKYTPSIPIIKNPNKSIKLLSYNPISHHFQIHISTAKNPHIHILITKRFSHP